MEKSINATSIYAFRVSLRWTRDHCKYMHSLLDERYCDKKYSMNSDYKGKFKFV